MQKRKQQDDALDARPLKKRRNAMLPTVATQRQQAAEAPPAQDPPAEGPEDWQDDVDNQQPKGYVLEGGEPVNEASQQKMEAIFGGEHISELRAFAVGQHYYHRYGRSITAATFNKHMSRAIRFGLYCQKRHPTLALTLSVFATEAGRGENWPLRFVRVPLCYQKRNGKGGGKIPT